MNTIVIQFSEQKKINRINLFVYPTTAQTNVQQDSGAKAVDYEISYAIDSALTNWVVWSGLKDRSEEIGQAATAISDGLTSGNTNTYNSFHDSTGVDAYGVKVIAIGTGTVKFTEIEVWRTLSLETFNRINIDEQKDIVNNKFLESLGAGTYIAKAEDFYPERGEFADVKAKDINKMRARVYGGYSQKGVDYWTIIRHFALYDWTVFLKSKKIEFRMKDKVKELKEKEVFLAAEVLEGKTREWLLEWMGLKSNLHSAEMDLFQSNDTVNYFYPVNQTVWNEMTQVAQGLNDIDLFVDRFGKLKWNVYLENIVHFWTINDYAKFQKCTLDNLTLSMEGDKAVVAPGGASGQVQVFSDSGFYEISLSELNITQDTWFLKATDTITIDAGKDTAIFNYNVRGVISADGLAKWQGRIKIEVWDGSTLIDSWTSDGDTSDPEVYREHSKNIGIAPGTYTVKRYLLGKYEQISTYEYGQTIWHTECMGCAMNELNVSESLRTFAGGSIESNVQDLLLTPDNWGALTTNFTGTQSTVSTNTSPDGTSWEGWKEIDSGAIKSKLDRYMKWKVEIPVTDLWVEFPKLYSVEVSYFSGSGTQRWSKISYEFSDDDLDELPVSFNDEREGQKQQFDKVEVAIEPFILGAMTDIWQGQVDWQTVKNKNYAFNPEFDNPVKIDGDYKLYINAVEFLEGETTHDNLTVTFTKHPVKPKIMIKQSGDTQVTITTGFKLTGKQYVRGNRIIASAGAGLKVLRIENNYINSSSFAQQIASNKYTELKNVIGSMDRDTGIKWLPVLNFLDVIQVKNTTLDITKIYRIYRISHEYNLLGSVAAVSTKIRCKEIDRSMFYDPLYWDDIRNEERIYWGADENGNPRYRGGRIFG